MLQIDLIDYGAIALLLTAWVAILAWTGLKGWNGWLELKRAELELNARDRQAGQGHLPAATRIDVADLKERIRKLEAIASGVDL